MAAWRRSPIVGAVAVIVILFSIGRLTCGSGSGKSPKYDYACSSSSCNFSGRLKVIRSKLPADCPKCGQKTLYSAMKCDGCGKNTPMLPPWQDFTCLSCGHHEEVRLDAYAAPHDCPKCKQKAFYQTLKCTKCDNVFAGKRPEVSEGEQNGMPMMPEAFMMGMFKCPKCGDMALPLSLEMMSTCFFCESRELKQITPSAVMKWEMGQPLKSNEQDIVDKWRKENKD